MRTSFGNTRSLVNEVNELESKTYITITTMMTDQMLSPIMYFSKVFVYIILNPNKDGSHGYTKAGKRSLENRQYKKLNILKMIGQFVNKSVKMRPDASVTLERADITKIYRAKLREN